MRVLTKKRLYNKALYYLSRYESTSSRLAMVLDRALKRAEQAGQELPAESTEWVREIVAQMEKTGYVDDLRYGENVQRKALLGGKSLRFVRGKLKMAGLADETIEKLMEETGSSPDELNLNAALVLVKKKKLGFMRPEEVRRDFYKKDLAVLGRAGFSFETAEKALKGED